LLTPCEKILKRYLPALKAGIAKELYERHDMNQVEIAKKLGLTQAAVSKYLSKGVGKNKDAAAVNSQISKSSKKIAAHIASSRLSEDELCRIICEECLKISNRVKCSLHGAMAAAKK